MSSPASGAPLPAQAFKPASTAPGDGAPPDLIGVLGNCISQLTDCVLITEAELLDEPGPRIVFANPAFCQLTGYTPQEVIGVSPRFLQGPKTDQAELRRIGQALRRWEVVRAELVNYAKDGTEFFVEMEIVPITGAEGRVTHWVSVQRNVTARKLAEFAATRREAQLSQSLGTLAAGIAHDFNNIVAAILGNVALARQDAADGKSGDGSLAQIQTAAVRARTLIQRILAYSRHTPECFEPVLLADVVAEATGLLRATIPSSVRMTVELAGDPFSVRADAAQLSQVLVNLGINAWHAIDGKPGTIRVSMGEAATPIALLPADGAGTQRYVHVTIDDDGCGMDEATRLRIFDPYFTTKAIGVGTGLGLAVAWGIVAEHRGTIEVSSVPGAGTSMRVVLPADGAAPAPVVAQLPAWHTVAGGNRRVLYVDDDEVVGVMMAALLRRTGFAVTVFNDPQLALEAVHAEPGRFDIVVTDFNMPALSGVSLAQQLRALRADLPVVLCSGYVFDGLLSSAHAAGVTRVFRKEFALEQLPLLLRELLSLADGADGVDGVHGIDGIDGVDGVHGAHGTDGILFTPVSAASAAPTPRH